MHKTNPPKIKTTDHNVSIGNNSQIYAHETNFGTNIRIGDNVTLVADSLTLESNVTISDNCDLRASDLKIGENSEVHSEVSILVAQSCSLGSACRLARGVEITCREFVSGNLLYMGDYATVGYGGTYSSTAFVRIGNCVTIGQYSILNANCPLEIHDNVGTGSYLAIWTHGYHFGHGPLEGINPAYAPISVGKNVWLGFQVTILPGVTIGENSMVAAGSVITKSMPSNVLVGGVPASVKKELDLSPVRGTPAFSAVIEVLEAWQTELDWKGYLATIVEHTESTYSIRVAGGDDELMVVLINEGAPLPNLEQQSAIITVDQREDLKLEKEHTLFCLRQGSLTGPSSDIVEDLRDQLRRYAMPCGETTTFSSITPAPFSRLKQVHQ